MDAPEPRRWRYDGGGGGFKKTQNKCNGRRPCVTFHSLLFEQSVTAHAVAPLVLLQTSADSYFFLGINHMSWFVCIKVSGNVAAADNDSNLFHKSTVILPGWHCLNSSNKTNPLRELHWQTEVQVKQSSLHLVGLSWGFSSVLTFLWIGLRR